MKTQYLIRAATISDLFKINDLLIKNSLSADDVAIHIEHFFVATQSDLIVGVAGLEVIGKYGLIQSVAVDECYRGLGIAASLCSALEERAVQIGIRRLYLLTESADQYFSTRGYTVVTRDNVPLAIRKTRQFSTLCPESATLMGRRLSRWELA